ncbi:Acetyltransferase (GNAT) domain-containing protein [Frankia canadensis]|uniref:Acetyltransferase (GNAT) domain-containing protein n=1 Tax=Frankia canadensis TaxID=1836972 RepID=A0A2I2L1I5_9ACTN|nr:GNAT family N-acetyltransferase [Frankia canadensis]SNQ51727.1 Acetyltransferase (GNAT) domain-containing protein [Frankia canadensis]SOU59017.1 Acetyltransferase (GNAT) domain-containing protein [Frankia canadensis]
MSIRIATPARSPLFCDVALAARIEGAEAGLIAGWSTTAGRRLGDAAGFVRPIAGGVASFAEADSPLNKVAGLGFDGVPSTSELDEVENAFAARGAAVQVELAHLVEEPIGALLTERGYRLVSFENVLGLALAAAGEPRRAALEGVEVRPSGAGELDHWVEVVADAVAIPDTQGVPSYEEFPREVIVNAMRDLAGASGLVRYAALRDGVLAGGASMRMSAGVAQFTGAATAPAHRRRGIQSALLTARLADAAAAGCDIAVVTTQPGSRSQHNVQRSGFDLLYTRAILVKEF